MGADQFAETLRNWRGLYKAALFETEESKLRLRIEEARRALVFRSRELFATSPSLGELHEIPHKGSQARTASLVEFCPQASDGEVLA